jgi:hypothetical protein
MVITKNNSVLESDPKQSLQQFLSLLYFIKKVDVEKIEFIATTTIDFLKSPSPTREQNRYLRELETRWYEALKSELIDYSVYSSDDYMAELRACWVVYSRHYLKAIQTYKSLPPNGIYERLKGIKSVADLGCGIAYTTAALKQMFPTARVIGTNLYDTIQSDFGKKMGEVYNFEIFPDITRFSSIDLIFASEYFEHILNPIDDLKIILRTNPKFLLIANSFSVKSIGNFNFYYDRGTKYTGKEISRLFNQELIKYGYKKIKTKLWNNRPNFWVKNGYENE